MVSLGDLAFRFPNEVEPWNDRIYARLRDGTARVRANAIMVLTHLILNDMVKVKGQVSELAACIVDKEPRIQHMAKHFFSEYSKRGANLIYNVLPDIVGRLSQDADVSPDDFKTIVGFLFKFLEKGKSQLADALIEKLCKRLGESEGCHQMRAVSFCISITRVTDKGLAKVTELVAVFKHTLHDKDVYENFMALLSRAKAFCSAETKKACDELHVKLKECHEGGAEDEDAAERAKRAKSISGKRAKSVSGKRAKSISDKRAKSVSGKRAKSISDKRVSQGGRRASRISSSTTPSTSASTCSRSSMGGEVEGGGGVKKGNQPRVGGKKVVRAILSESDSGSSNEAGEEEDEMVKEEMSVLERKKKGGRTREVQGKKVKPKYVDESREEEEEEEEEVVQNSVVNVRQKNIVQENVKARSGAKAQTVIESNKEGGEEEDGVEEEEEHEVEEFESSGVVGVEMKGQRKKRYVEDSDSDEDDVVNLKKREREGTGKRKKGSRPRVIEDESEEEEGGEVEWEDGEGSGGVLNDTEKLADRERSGSKSGGGEKSVGVVEERETAPAARRRVRKEKTEAARKRHEKAKVGVGRGEENVQVRIESDGVREEVVHACAGRRKAGIVTAEVVRAKPRPLREYN
ncbi:unnamed protein product [Choristocarpus tenellus]